MNLSIESKLHTLVERHEEVSHLLGDPEIITNNQKFRQLSKEYAELEPVVANFAAYKQNLKEQQELQQMLKEDDAEIKQMAQEELKAAVEQEKTLERELLMLLIPKDPNDDKDIFLEVRAGTGGDEAAIFAGDLARMYMRYAESQRWQVEVVSRSEGEHGGYKEIIMRVSGNSVYGKLKFESGIHRVQRVPTTETQGRVHTSACTVAVMPEVAEVEGVEINNNDLRIDTYRASGAGGQHVNKTDSAIRITHLPTGIVVECQDERSQHKNKARAMSLLQSKLLTMEQQKQQQEQAETRRNLVGSGDRSGRIRTYNFPQGRLTDHRINLTLYKLPEIIEGDLDEVVCALQTEYQADKLQELET